MVPLICCLQYLMTQTGSHLGRRVKHNTSHADDKTMKTAGPHLIHPMPMAVGVNDSARVRTTSLTTGPWVETSTICYLVMRRLSLLV